MHRPVRLTVAAGLQSAAQHSALSKANYQAPAPFYSAFYMPLFRSNKGDASAVTWGVFCRSSSFFAKVASDTSIARETGCTITLSQYT